MNNKLLKSVIAGIVATIAMTAMMMIGAKMGMPKMEPPKTLAITMGAPMAVGWVMHFMIGIVLALMYSYFFRGLLSKVSSVFLKGVIFGIIALVFAKIGMSVMGMMFPDMPKPQGSMMPILLAMTMGHILFGVVTTQMIHRND